MYNSLFNTPEGQEFAGIQTDNEFGKAKKGSPGYEEWLRKYREKRAGKTETSESSQQAKKEAKEVLASTKKEKLDINKLADELGVDKEDLDYAWGDMLRGKASMTPVSDVESNYIILADKQKSAISDLCNYIAEGEATPQEKKKFKEFIKNNMPDTKFVVIQEVYSEDDENALVSGYNFEIKGFNSAKEAWKSSPWGVD